MSDLEKYMKDNRRAFDGDEPAEGHFERFERRLQKRENDHNKKVWFWRVAAAAIILLGVLGSLVLPRLNSTADVQYGSLSLSEVSGDMADIEAYYSSELAKGYENLETLSQEDERVKTLFTELENLAREYSELEKQLYRSGTNDRVVLAMIENFRFRLEIIEELEKIKREQSN